MRCLSRRRRGGLHNASNGSENVNDVPVARWQKDDHQAWREEGSSSASNISCLFYNGEDVLWFNYGVLTFEIQNKEQTDMQM